MTARDPRAVAEALVESYFAACGTGTVDDIAGHFTDDAVIYDTNLAPVRTAQGIGSFWVKVRERWHGARWYVDSLVATTVEPGLPEIVAAIEWSMTGADESRSFVFRGSEHYRIRDGRIAEIRQYWTFDPETLDTGLVDYPYPS